MSASCMHFNSRRWFWVHMRISLSCLCDNVDRSSMAKLSLRFIKSNRCESAIIKVNHKLAVE